MPFCYWEMIGADFIPREPVMTVVALILVVNRIVGFFTYKIAVVNEYFLSHV